MSAGCLLGDSSDELPTDCKIENQAEGLIERLGEIAVFCPPSLLDLPRLSVERPAELTGLPFNAIDMEVLGEIDAVEPLRQSCVFVPWPTASMPQNANREVNKKGVCTETMASGLSGRFA